ncbi:3582_t:CDS:1, partial [Acaulospora morrowiae]
MDKGELDVNSVNVDVSMNDSSRHKIKEITFREDEVLRSFGITRRVTAKAAFSTVTNKETIQILVNGTFMDAPMVLRVK